MASAPSLRVGAMALGPIKAKLGITNFRQGQLECISALALRGRDAWVGFACGGGKSLVYAATMLQKGGIGLLVEPLNAITDAMELYFTERGIEVIALRTAKDSSNACAAQPRQQCVPSSLRQTTFVSLCRIPWPYPERGSTQRTTTNA